LHATRLQERKRAAAIVIVALAAVAAWTIRTATQAPPAAPAATPFAALSERLSEPNGEFDTDNLISNESSYLHVIPALEQGGVTGGVYVGVGPDQNFSYIARIRPASAFIIDIRRDNLLMHLLFKAIFSESRNRMEYLRIVTYLDAAKPAAAAVLAAEAGRLHEAIRKTGMALSLRDLATIDRFHGQFIRAGLGLKFQSTGRPTREYYPTYRDLLLETDRRGRQLCYLASEGDFQFVKELEAKDLIVPVVGDLAGPHALAAIGQEVARRGEKVSAFYNSNIENYLFRDGSFPRYMENVKKLPHSDKSVIIRSLFGGYALPESAPGYYSTSAVQTIDALIANCGASRCRGYFDLLRK